MGELKILKKESQIILQKKLQEDFSPLKMKLKNINSLDKAIQSETPTIGKIMADTNPEYTQSLLIMWLLWLDQNMSYIPLLTFYFFNL